jgi:xylose dehydrogenase (NAD/NADP)
MDGNPLRLGVLGCADIAVSRVVPALRGSSQVVVQALASRDAAKAARWAEKLGVPAACPSYAELLQRDDVEAVYVPLVNSLHCPWTLAALQAGKHVLCEKPLALTVKEARRMVETARSENRVLMEGFMYRHHPRTRKALELVRGGQIGELASVQSEFSYFLPDSDGYLFDRERGGGALYDVGCYCVELARAVAGGEPIQVFATQNLSPGGVDLSFDGLMRFNGGVLSAFHVSMKEEPRFGYRLVGSRGLVEAPWAFVSFGREAHLLLQRSEKAETLTFAGVDEYRLQFEHFADVIRGRAEPLVPIEESLGNLRVLEALRRSAVRNRPVRLKGR